MTDTTPAPVIGTDLTRLNALRHGVLSRFTVLPWESEAEYLALLAALAGEHAPHGPTEEHLVEELAGVIWRKRRLRLAEAAALRRGLEGTLDVFGKTAKAALAHLRHPGRTERPADAIRATAAETEAALRDIEEDEAMTRAALTVLEPPRPDSYPVALATLRADTRRWWTETLAAPPTRGDTNRVTPDADSLRHFLESEVLPLLETRRQELAARPLIREQALGEALDPDKLDPLARYEVHLDRKLERTLAMLIRLREMRAGEGKKG